MSLKENLLNFFKPPSVETEEFQIQIKTKFVWRITLLTTISIAALSVISFITEREFFPWFLLGFALAFTCLLVLKKVKQNYVVPLNFLYIGMVAIQYFSILFMPQDAHYIEALYLLLISLFSFFTLGRKWGYFYLGLTSLVYFIFFNFKFLTLEDFEVILNNGSLVGNSLEFAICMFLFSYVMYHYEKLNNHAEELYLEALTNLQKEKEVVEYKNKEKTILLQEIHHRVKNNLQVIISLLRMQSGTLKSKEAKESFNKAISRIMTMALVHQKMYEKDSLTNINLKDYIENLLVDIINSNITNANINYKLNIELGSLSPERIVPLGLILNELISNSLKYAFKDQGKIEIEISQIDDSKFRMTYADDGTWVESTRYNTFGLSLIDIFTEQFDGEFERKISDTGTYYNFELYKLDKEQ